MSTYDPTNQTPNEEIDAAAEAELSDDQLEDVAGGWSSQSVQADQPGDWEGPW